MDDKELDEKKEKMRLSEMVVPPGFYEEDMAKWDKKFKTARDSRQQHKMMIKSLGCF